MSKIDHKNVELIIKLLNEMDVDGETMEYILRKVGMEDQMANQLVHYPNELRKSRINQNINY